MSGNFAIGFVSDHLTDILSSHFCPGYGRYYRPQRNRLRAPPQISRKKEVAEALGLSGPLQTY